MCCGDLVRALVHLNSVCKIVHRDLKVRPPFHPDHSRAADKPVGCTQNDNVMVTATHNYEVKNMRLIDLGQARYENDTSAEKTFEGADQNS